MLLLQLYLYVIMVSVFGNSQSSFFMWSPLVVESGLQSTCIFRQRLTAWTVHHTFLERYPDDVHHTFLERYPDDTKNQYYVSPLEDS